MMRFRTLILAGLVTMVASGSTVRAQSLSDLLEEGIFKEETVGDLDAAIKIYERIVAEGTKNRSYAAQAQYRVGMCYLKQGKKDQAAAALQKLVADFPNQKKLAALARVRLSELGYPATHPEAAPPGPIVRKIWSGTEATVDILGTPTPDGRYLTFVDWTTGDLAIRDVVSGESRRLTNRGYPEYALLSSVSPDGRKVAYFWTVGPRWHPQLWVVGIDGSNPHPVFENPGNDVTYLDPVGWTPDSQRILVELSRGNTTQLAFVSLEDRGLEVIRTHDWLGIFKAGLSPDGRWIVYDFPPSEDSPQRDIYLLAADGSREIPLVRHPAHDIHPVWTPDGKRVLFSSDRAGTTGLWSIRVQDGRPVGQAEVIKRDMAQGFWPMGFTRDGALFYATDLGGGDVYTAKIDPKTGAARSAPHRSVDQFQGRNTSPSWSPDGKRLAYVSRRRQVTIGQGAVLIVRDVGSGKELEVSGLRLQRKWSRPRWSPDSRTVLVNARARKKPRDDGLYRVDASSGAFEPVNLSGEDTRVFQGFWSPDGRSILFIWGRRTPDGEGAVGISRLNLETGEEQLISTPVMDNGKRGVWAPSPDGASIALVGRASEDESVLYVVPLETGKPREVLRIEKPRYFRGEVGLAWTADGRHLLFALGQPEQQMKNPVELLRVAVDGGEPEPVGIAMREIRHLSVLPDGRGISFAAGPMVHQEVYVMENFLPEPKVAAASGMMIRRVWEGSGVDVTGAPSLDSRYLSFVDWSTGDVAIRDLATGENRRLTNKGYPEQAFAPKFSPDGKQVAYAWFNEDSFHDLRVVGIEDSEPRVLYTNEEVIYIVPTAWSPDGKHILANFQQRDLTIQIVLVSIADGSVQVLKTLDWRYPLNMSLSPDGRYIVYDVPTKEDAPERDIFLLATDGSREIALVEHAANDLFAVWAPDGKTVVFLSDRAGSMGLWAIQVASGKPVGIPRLVKQGIAERSRLMGFTRNGSLYYGHRASMNVGEVYTATLDIPAGKVLVEPSPVSERFVGSNIASDWSPDGKYLAFVSQRGVRGPQSEVIVIRSVETGEEREIPLAVGRFVTRPRWSPDGASFLVAGSHQKKGRGLYRVSAVGGDVTRIVPYEGVVGISRWAWSPDGKAVFYHRIDSSSKVQTIVRRELETGKEQIIDSSTTTHMIRDLTLSPDGRQLALIRYDSKPGMSITVMPATGGEPRELIRVQKPEYIYGGFWREGLAWTPDGRYLLFGKIRTDVEDQTVELWRVPVGGGEPQRLGVAMDNVRDVRVHPDGRRISFTAGKISAEVWKMENFLPELTASR